MLTPEDFKNFEYGPFLAKCKCGELAEITSFKHWDKNHIEETDYYMECLNCGRKGFICTLKGPENEEFVAKMWTAFVEAEERFSNKKK